MTHSRVGTFPFADVGWRMWHDRLGSEAWNFLAEGRAASCQSADAWSGRSQSVGQAAQLA